MNIQNFAIVQTKNDENRVIEIKDSETILGRGKFLEISDKKVSRTHACLKLKDIELTLVSTHLNPCFVNLKRRNKKILLKQGGSIKLEDGDEFSLLQDKHYFQVKCTTDIKQNELTYDLKNKEACGFIANVDSSVETNPVNIVTCSNISETLTKVTESNTPSKPKKLCKILKSFADPLPNNCNGASVVKRKRKLPSWMLNKDKDPLIQKQTSHSSDNAAKILPLTIFEHRNNVNEKDLQSSTTVTKRSFVGNENTLPSTIHNQTLEGNEVSHKIDTNEVILSQKFSISSSTSTTPDGNTTTTFSTYSNSNAKDIKQDNSPLNSCSSTKREACAYGRSCYRKNPAHFQECSHPGDDDYVSESSDGDDAKPECEFGLQCYRKNPLHKKMFKHILRVTPKRAAATAKSRDSDEYDDSFIDDDDEEDLSEESDWEPSPKKKLHGKNDETTSESDENIDDLLDTAKQFTKNKKLWKK